ncbi:M14 family metallopeptidase [Fulvivirga ulvae]|uniref:M14 metallopeptidase family protein n=1 Tax=Fulvivirga ulvae TaxID=2904245 RepID=UPI001F19F3FA|nr:M14 metallopeptidase family protein [Fulvivirga ulvae]UII34455.1 M14 family metallopeptidase [Fulvivirga ulvae]
MKKILVLAAIISTLISLVHAQKFGLKYYLPQQASYNPEIPTPQQVIGHEIGEWHISHDRLVNYMYKLAEASDRIQIKEYAQTFEARPLLILTISSKKNISNIEEIKGKHAQLANSETSGQLDLRNMPAVVYMGYSVHGNEASGSNAALLVAYHLAAAQGSEIEKLLDETVILLDPSFNPDGLQRFSGWVNSRKSHNISADPNNMEQNEAWPGGRTNHYWFDLNRDWLPAQLPESRGRVALFHEWKPNVLTDHHEMGTNSTFFFQPGIPSRNNPLTPKNTYTLTSKMGEYHAKALDDIGSLYYTKESYDDYYYGKGSTYPDINGGVGVLFEQASSRGHAQESIHGILEFPFTIRNQVTTSFSTLKAVNEMRADFLEHQRNFYQEAALEAQKDQNKAYIFASKDEYRSYHLAQLISRHQINIYHPKKPMEVNGFSFSADQLYVVPLSQPQYRLIKAMFETRTEFQDSLFYDISTWTLPLAFGMEYEVLSAKTFNNNLLGQPFSAEQKPAGKIIGQQSPYAYAFEWYGYYAPKLLNELLKRGYSLKVGNEVFNGADGKQFARGSIIIPVGIQDKTSDAIYNTLSQLAIETGIDIYALTTGLDYNGVSLGSRSFDKVQKPKIMMLVGEGVTPYDAGEVWHLMDQRYDIDLSLVPINEFSRIDMDKYNTLIMVNGRYNDISTPAKDKLKTWLQNGGTIVASKNALKFLASSGFGKFEFEKLSDKDSLTIRKYADISETEGAREIGGAIFETKVDTTHPLLYGYYKPTLPIFRNSRLFLKKADNSFANPILYSDSPLLSGYISKGNLDLLKGTSAVGISNYGKGVIIGFTDNLNFRAFWHGTNKIFMNAVFFGPNINRAAGR